MLAAEHDDSELIRSWLRRLLTPYARSRVRTVGPICLQLSARVITRLADVLQPRRDFDSTVWDRSRDFFSTEAKETAPKGPKLETRMAESGEECLGRGS